jgi:hypothetical protein
MAVRPEKPGQGTIAVTAAALVLTGLIAAPVLAAPERDLQREEDVTPNLSLSATDLTATPVNSSEELLKDHLLRPRADSAARAAFADEVAEESAEEESAEESIDAVATKPLVPSASENEPSPYKRQMYRRDI